MTITQDLVDSINKALDKGLVKGLGDPVEGELCVEALICLKLGLPHSDDPPCVGKEVRFAKIVLNDCIWSSNLARAEGMRKLAVAQLGSDKLNQDEFKNKLELNSTKRILPFLIQKHFDSTKDSKLLDYKIKFENLTSLDDALWLEFYNYNNNYNNNYNYYYYYNKYNSYYYYYNKYNKYNYGDEFLLLIADTILQILKEMNCEGCKWLPKD